MCGIHFIFDKHSRLDLKPVQAMVSATEYRGPDDGGIKMFKVKEAQYFLGANKLNITDSSHLSNQPFRKDPLNKVLVYNGEIYNNQDLKNNQLQQGLDFLSESDTEVLYHHIIHHETSGLSALNGMFAFLMLDTRSGEFLVARDPWGMKPLFFHEDDDYFILSSEIKGIMASGLVKKELNPFAVNQYLKYRYVRGPVTFYNDINEFEPNTWTKIRADGESTSGKIKSKVKRAQGSPNNYNQVLKEVDQLLSDALLLHLNQKGVTGLFLSGGVDSTLMLAKLFELGVRQVPTFSFISSEEDRSYGTEDFKYAGKAAQQFQASHHEIKTHIDILEGLDQFVKGIDQPVGDSGSLMTYLLSKEISATTRIALSGAGADELFGGYNRHRAYQYYLQNSRWLKYLKNSGKSGAALIGLFTKGKTGLVQKFMQSVDKDPSITWDRFISVSSFWDTDIKNDGWEDISNLEMALEDDQDNYLINDVLAISDRSSMQASLEMRMPYLDSGLSSYANSLSTETLLMHGSKSILKDLLEKKGGKVYTRRPKEGFGLPFGPWINKEKIGLWDFLKVKTNIVFTFVPQDFVLTLLKEHKSGTKDHTLTLWSILILAKWLENTFD